MKQEGLFIGGCSYFICIYFFILRVKLFNMVLEPEENYR